MGAEKPDVSRDINRGHDIRGLLESKQAQLDLTLETLGEEVEFWNMRLAAVDMTDEDARVSQWQQLAVEAMHSLDGKWPFTPDYLHVSGKWYDSKLFVGGDRLVYQMEEKEVFETVQSNGFQAFQEDEDLPPRMGLSFYNGQINIARAALQGRLHMLAFAELKDVTLIYARPANAEEMPTDIRAFQGKLAHFDKLLYDQYHAQSSKFFKKTAEQQGRILTKIIDSLSDSLPAPESGRAAVCRDMLVPYVYTHANFGDYKLNWIRVQSGDDEPLILCGSVQGVSVLESPMVASGQPLRSTSELIDEDASICLVLKIEDGNMPADFEGQLVHVPWRLAEQAQIESS